MGERSSRVFEQNNGARIVVSTAPTTPEVFEDVTEPIVAAPKGSALERATGGVFSASRPAKKAGRVRRSSAVARSGGKTGQAGEVRGRAMMFGAAAFLACAIGYNAIIIGTGFVFRPLTIGCGALIGLAVQQGNTRRYMATNMLYAGALAYMCVSSTYVYWFFDEIMHPENYMHLDAVVVADMVDSVWGGSGGYTPEVPEVPGVLEGLWTAVMKSILFPLVLLQQGAIYEVVWGLMAVGAAWKAAAPKDTAG